MPAHIAKSFLPVRFDPLMAIATLGWIALLGLMAFWPSVPHWPLRLGVTMLGLAVVWRLWIARPMMLLSPLLLLALVTIGFFSLLPAIYASPERLPTFRLPYPVEQYFSGPAELMLLHFALLLLTIVLALRPYPPAASLENGPGSELVARAATAGVISLIVALAARRLFPEFGRWLQTGIGMQILHGIPPLMSFFLVVLTRIAAIEEHWRLTALAAGIVGCAALFSLASAKAPVFIAGACVLLYTLVRPQNLRKLWWSSVAMIVGIALSVLILAEIRSNSLSDLLSGKDSRGISALSDAIAYKLLLRQVDTVGCFSNVVERRLFTPAERSPFYFLSGVVPRVMWQDKPNLSQGDRFAIEYCDIPPNSVYGPEIVHSASVTLLGEPIIAAGLVGLVVAQATVAGLLTILTLLLLRNSLAGPIALTALLPWLVDLDQSFALYFASAAKMFVYMSPGIVLLVWADRHTRAKRTSSA